MADDKPVNDDLGPLQPHKKPRKTAKVVLAGLVAAAGVAAGTAIVATNVGCHGVPVRNVTTQPAQTTQPGTTRVSAEPQLLLGDMAAPVSLKAVTQPGKAAHK